MLICDFCSTPNPTVKYDCASFIMMETGPIVHWSDEAWAACEQCAALINADKWSDLVDRVVKALPMRIDFKQEQEYRKYLTEMYQKFRQAKGQVA